MSSLRLHLGPNVIHLSSRPEPPEIVFGLNGQTILCSPDEIASLGQALAFIVGCHSQAHAKAVLNFEPSEVQNDSGERMY